PFEKDFYAKFGYDVEFTGNPLLDAIEEYREENRMSFEEFTGSAGLQEKPIIALLPGSRKQEIKTMLPVMTEVAGKFPDYQFVISAAPSISSEFIAENNSNRLPVFHGKTYSLLEHSSAALVTSGTATLETALFRIPEAVCYKSGYLSYQIAKKLIKVKYISLVNLIIDRVVVKELIQSEMNVAKLCEELDKMLNDNEYRNKMLADFDFLIKKLGGRGASRRTALKMAEFINSIRI
ncbi:MAG: lipid-A-disaccharide synthase, partial [Bacteroidota bacterium]